MRRRETHRWEGAETEFYRKLEAGYMGEVRWEKEVGGGGRGKASGEGKGPREKSCTAVGTCGLQPGGREAEAAGKVARRKVLGVSSTVPDSGVPGALWVTEPVRRSPAQE